MKFGSCGYQIGATCDVSDPQSEKLMVCYKDQVLSFFLSLLQRRDSSSDDLQIIAKVLARVYQL